MFCPFFVYTEWCVFGSGQLAQVDRELHGLAEPVGTAEYRAVGVRRFHPDSIDAASSVVPIHRAALLAPTERITRR